MYLHCVLHPLSRLDVAHGVSGVSVLCAYWALTNINALSLSVGDRTVAVGSFGVKVRNPCGFVVLGVRTQVSVHELSRTAAHIKETMLKSNSWIHNAFANKLSVTGVQQSRPACIP